jgi:hypothetical protein
MGSMIFDHKHWLRDKWHHNRCQLWPRILYPGMGEGKTGTDPGDYPDSVKLGDLLTSDQLDYNVSPDEIGKELAPTTQEPAPIDDRPCETETDDQTTRVQEHVDDYVREHVREHIHEHPCSRTPINLTSGAWGQGTITQNTKNT